MKKETKKEREIRKETIVQPTKEQIESYLNRIGWKLVNHGCDFYYFYDNKGKNREWYIWHDRIEWKEDFVISCVFYLTDISIEMTGKNAVSIMATKNKSVFLQFANHDIKNQYNTK